MNRCAHSNRANAFERLKRITTSSADSATKPSLPFPVELVNSLPRLIPPGLGAPRLPLCSDGFKKYGGQPPFSSHATSYSFFFLGRYSLANAATASARSAAVLSRAAFDRRAAPHSSWIASTPPPSRLP